MMGVGGVEFAVLNLATYVLSHNVLGHKCDDVLMLRTGNTAGWGIAPSLHPLLLPLSP